MATKKKRKRRLPRQARNSQTRAAAMAAATKGRTRVFKDKRKRGRSVKSDIEEQLDGE